MNLYQEEIMEHYRHPHHAGTLEHPTLTRTERNSSCGDELTFTFLITNNTVTDVAFTGNGCAISQASASMLSDELIGKTVQEVSAMTTEDILDLLGIELGPTRLKCALLPLQATTRAMNEYQP